MASTDRSTGSPGRPAGGRPARPARSPPEEELCVQPVVVDRQRQDAGVELPVAQLLQDHLGLLLDQQQLEVGEAGVDLGHDVGEEVGRQRWGTGPCAACPTRGRRPGWAMPWMLSTSPRMTWARSTTRSPASVSRTWRGCARPAARPALLELLELHRERRLADEARLGGLAEVAVVGHGDQVLRGRAGSCRSECYLLPPLHHRRGRAVANAATARPGAAGSAGPTCG